MLEFDFVLLAQALCRSMNTQLTAAGGSFIFYTSSYLLYHPRSEPSSPAHVFLMILQSLVEKSEKHMTRSTARVTRVTLLRQVASALCRGSCWGFNSVRTDTRKRKVSFIVVSGLRVEKKAPPHREESG